MSSSESPRAVLVGTGLIGGSIGMALRQHGWHVSGDDVDRDAAQLALELGALDRIGDDPGADVGIVATPVGVVTENAQRLLGQGVGVVSDVGSTKARIVEGLQHARFVGGHPMAGSEQVGVQGASADLFSGAAWVLTPGAHTSDEALLRVRGIVTMLGAEPITLDATDHDRLVAMVSHVPHLAAATLMRIATRRSTEHRALLRLAAGGFRDMTRVAAGHPGIWPDICEENRDAIVDVLDEVIDELGALRSLVADSRRDELYEVLEEARGGRLNLPVAADLPDELAELRVPVPDRPGALADVTTCAATLGVNIYDLEIAHSGEGDRGVLVLLVAAVEGAQLLDALGERGLRGALDPL